MYEVQARIEQRNIEEGTNYHISLRELAWWRAQEIGMASWLARVLPKSPVNRGEAPKAVQHYVVGVKHPVEMVRKLLFEPQVARIYASYPISSTRDEEESRREIDKVRARLHSLHTVFDPLIIDELSPWVISQAEKAGSSTIKLEKDDSKCRWPLPAEGTLCEGRRNVYPITLQAKEVLNVRPDVEHSIRVRDFGLVDSCDCIVGYRPYYRGIFSRGMFAEFDHALNVCRPPVPIHYYAPPSDDVEGSPFAQFRTPHRDENRWWQVVENLRPLGR